jgi:DNA ligase D-like protein (predicted 3'-phosphoesterase)
MAMFVVQEHDATTLHWDFRLELDGVLKSWAVPKGPPTDPSEKRLAIEVADHAISWADFEGEIERGYGAGTVECWDRGEWEPITEGDPGRALKDGHLSFRLDGRRLKGGYTLQRTRGGSKPQWLLLKRRDSG